MMASAEFAQTADADVKVWVYECVWRARVRLCVRVRERVRMCERESARVFVCVYMISWNQREWMRRCVYIDVFVCVYMCVCVCVCVCVVYVSLREHMWWLLYTAVLYTHVSAYTCTHT